MFKKLNYRIGSHFLPLIFNGDATGLSDDDERSWELFERLLPAPGGHWATTDERDEFAVCEVTGLYSNIETLTYCYR